MYINDLKCFGMPTGFGHCYIKEFLIPKNKCKSHNDIHNRQSLLYPFSIVPSICWTLSKVMHAGDGKGAENRKDWADEKNLDAFSLGWP